MNLAFVPLLLMSLWATFGCHSRNSENDANSVGTENSISKKVSIEQVQSLVNQVLKSKSDNALLYSFEGFCLDVASQWIPEIMAAKIPANMQQTNAVHFFFGQTAANYEIHFCISLMLILERECQLSFPLNY